MRKRGTLFLLLILAVLAAVVPPAQPARAAAIEERLVGTYKGQFIGEDYGTFLLALDAEGLITGNGMSTKNEVPLTFSGSCNPDGTLVFSTVDGSMVFTGSIDWMNRMGGKWARTGSGERGSFGGVLQKP
jgi:hypothetical protein